MTALEPKLETCPECAGHGYQPTQTGVEKCPACKGGGYTPVELDLGPSRSSPGGRTALWNAGLGELTITRNNKDVLYRVTEIGAESEPNERPARGFRLDKILRMKSGLIESVVETHHVRIGAPGTPHTCDCPGFLSDAVAKGNDRAFKTGEPIYPSFGCVHLDSVLRLVWGELFLKPVTEETS